MPTSVQAPGRIIMRAPSTGPRLTHRPWQRNWCVAQPWLLAAALPRGKPASSISLPPPTSQKGGNQSQAKRTARALGAAACVAHMCARSSALA